MDLSFLPAVNAGLNAVAAVLLVIGRRLIRRRREAAHRATMIAAFGVSSVFLALYVAHKVWRNFETTTFHVEGVAKIAYLLLLSSHVVLAMTVPFFAVTLIVLGLRERRLWHVRLARIAWPIWMYVSLTGIAVYVLLYHLNPVPGLS